MRRTCLVALLFLFSIASGCLTPEMGHEASCFLDATFDAPREPRGKLDEEGLPARIWYVDHAARIYHERRTNTFLAWNEPASGRAGWIALPERRAFERFRPERARLLADGAPADVERALDFLVETEPTWRGL